MNRAANSITLADQLVERKYPSEAKKGIKHPLLSIFYFRLVERFTALADPLLYDSFNDLQFGWIGLRYTKHKLIVLLGVPMEIHWFHWLFKLIPLIWLVKVALTTWKTASAEVGHGVELDGDQGVGFDLPWIGEVTMQRRDQEFALLVWNDEKSKHRNLWFTRR